MSAGVGLHAQASNGKSTDKASRPSANKVQPTPEQLRLAQISQKSDHDEDLRNKVATVASLANCDHDAASFALHDCELDVQLAVNMLLEAGETDYHQQVIRKKKGGKGNSSGEVSDVADTITANSKDSNGIQGETVPDRGVRKTGRVNAPPRMQPHRGIPATSRARGEYRNEYTSQNDAKDGVSNGEIEHDPSLNARGGRGRGRGRGGWHGTRGSRNYSRPGRYNRAEGAAAAGGEADPGTSAEQPGLRNHGSGAGTALEGGSGMWELEVDEWTGSLKESQVFTARTLDSSTSPQPHTAAGGLDGGSGSYGAATAFDGPAAAPALPSASLLVGGSIYASSSSSAVESGVVTASHRDSVLPRQHTAMADDLSRSIAATITAGTTTDRVQVQASSFSSPAVEQSLYMNNVYDRQLASDTIKHAIGIPTSAHTVPVVPTVGPLTAGNVQTSQNKVKLSRTKLPPPTKIPTAAVEMPHKASSIPIHALGVQFGNLDLGTETPSSLDPQVREKQPTLSSTSKAVPPAGLQATSLAALTNAGSITIATATAANSGATVPGSLQSKANENSRVASEQQHIGPGSAPGILLSQSLSAAASTSGHVQQQQHASAQVAAAHPVPPASQSASQSVYVAAGQQQAVGPSLGQNYHHHHQQQQQHAPSSAAASAAGAQYTAASAVSSVHAQPAAATGVLARPVAPAAQAAAAASSPSTLPVTSATSFSAASALNPALLASNLNALPPAGSHLYSSYPQMYTPMPPNLGGAGGYSGVQNPAYANMNYLADGGMYASQYYTDAVYEASALHAGGGVSAGNAGPSSMQSTSAISSSTSTTPTSSGSRMNTTGSKPPAPGLPPGIGLPLQPPAAAYMNMTGPGHMAMSGGPYFGPMYAFDEYQKLHHSLAFYDPNQYQLVGGQAAGPAGAFTVGSDGKLSLMDGQGGVVGGGGQLPGAAVTASGQQQSGGGSVAAGGGGGGTMTLQQQQHYVGGGGSGATSTAAGAGLHHAYPPYYFPAYSPAAVFPAMHSNAGLNPALSGTTTSGGYPKGSAYGYGPGAGAVGGPATYDEVAHMQDYNKSHSYGPSQSSSKGSANMSSAISAGNGNSGGANLTHGGTSPSDVASMYKHGMTQVAAAYNHAAANSHMNSQAGGPMGGYSPYMLNHQQQVVLQGTLGGQDTSGGGRSGHAGHAPSMSTGGGSGKPLGAGGSKVPSYSSAGAASWGPQY